jgi:NAD(P)-dependent dehydrogenase (short-subunit alcohol dehydrogenase family)
LAASQEPFGLTDLTSAAAGRMPDLRYDFGDNEATCLMLSWQTGWNQADLFAAGVSLIVSNSLGRNYFREGSRGHMEGATAIGAAFSAIETLIENLAFEVGSAGVRAVCLRTTANTDSRTIRQTMEAPADNMNVRKDQ